MKKYTIDQNGRSMIEMLGVLAIVGVLSVAGIAGYSKAMAKYKINKVMDQVSTIAANTKTLFASMGSYAGLTGNVQAYKLGLFPDDMTKTCTAAANAESCVKNGMNGAVFIIGSTNDFTISMSGLTKEACTALFTSDWGGAAGFKAIKGGTAIADEALEVPETASAANGYTPADLITTGVYTAAKASCTAETGNAVTWVFY